MTGPIIYTVEYLLKLLIYSKCIEIAFLKCQHKLTIPLKLFGPEKHWNRLIYRYKRQCSFFPVFVCFSADAFEISERQNNPVFAKPGGSVTFICPYDIGGLVQQVKWERIKAGGTDTIVLCTSVGGRSFGSDFKNRALVDCSGQASSTVVIQNITASDYTTYRCVATGRNKTFEMSFTVVGK